MNVGELREQVWVRLMKARALAYPYPPFGHHPNFRGASKAARVLLEALLAQGRLKPGDTVLCYPDYVLKSLRKALLEAGVRVVVPAKYGAGYRLLDPLRVAPVKASSIAGAEKEGALVETLPPLTLVVVACVAVTREGAALGKGYGFRVPDEAAHLPRMSVVHPLQIVPDIASSEHRLIAFATQNEPVWVK